MTNLEALRQELREFVDEATDRDLWESCLWVGDNYDNNRFSRGLVCKTEEEAVELARRMLAVAKEGKNNG